MIYVIFNQVNEEVYETESYEDALRYLLWHPTYKIRKFLLT